MFLRSSGWSGAPAVLSLSARLLLRLVAALFPIATLWVSKLIIDLVVRAIRHQAIDQNTDLEALAAGIVARRRLRHDRPLHQPGR